MPPDHRFISYTRNAEDVVLWRALGELPSGRYVEVGAGRPTSATTSRALTERGWTGIVVGADPALEDRLRAERPGDVVRTDAADRLSSVLDEHLDPDDDVHVLVVERDGTSGDPLDGLDLRHRRPWVIVVEAPSGPDLGPVTAVLSEAGYERCLFDGLFCFFVAAERAEALRSALSTPANPHDDFVPEEWHRQQQELAAAREEVDRWRDTALTTWAEATGAGSAGSSRQPGHEVVRLREELAATRATLSWRITAPLRTVQERRLRGWR